MKPEPLTNLEKQCHDFLNFKKPLDFKGCTLEGFYIEEENTKEIIKSACEWLKKRLGYECDEEVEEAFEGVYDETNKKK